MEPFLYRSQSIRLSVQGIVKENLRPRPCSRKANVSRGYSGLVYWLLGGVCTGILEFQVCINRVVGIVVNLIEFISKLTASF